MRNLLLLLLLANILYFVWGTFVSSNDEPGVAVVAEAELRAATGCFYWPRRERGRECRRSA